MSTISTDSFAVYRGTVDKIKKAPITNGSVYFATDENKIYFDANRERHVIGGSGVAFYYGAEPKPEALGAEQYLITFAKVDAAKVNVDDIILNADGGFYRVEEVIDVGYACSLMAISGTGGGSSSSNYSVSRDPDFPANAASGQPVSATFNASTTEMDASYVDIKLTVTNLDGTVNTIPPSRIRLAPTEDGRKKLGSVEVTIDGKYIKDGLNTIAIAYRFDTQLVDTNRVAEITGKTVTLIAGNAWNPMVRFNYGENKNVEYSYQLKGVTPETPVVLHYALDGIEVYTSQEIQVEQGKHDLTDCFSYAAHGGHELSVWGEVKIGNTWSTLGDPLVYNIMWVVEGNESPIIISPYFNKTEINYSIIKIPYMIYDPTSATNSAKANFFINGTELSTGAVEVPYDALKWAEWQIKDYVVGENTFLISCGGTNKEFSVTVIVDSERNLDPINTNVYAHLSSFGRSNNESALNRSTWKSGDIAATLTGFNWYNNGWVTNEEDSNTVLRITNGAAVSIPMGDDILNANTLDTGAAYTFEIDFRIKNAIDFSRLITLTEVKDETTGKVTVEKTVHTEEGVVIDFFDQQKSTGMCVGTQEAFFKSQSKIVNVKYTDGDRVKVSFVIDSKTQLIYAYVNGVISGIVEFDAATEVFGIPNNRYLTINSEYCDIDIYNIRIYTQALDYIDIVQNWVGDSSDLDTKLWRYDFNHLTDSMNTSRRNEIDYLITMKTVKAAALSGDKEKQEQAIPIMVIKTYDKTVTGSDSSNKMPYKKGNKIMCSMKYFDPMDLTRESPKKSFMVTNMELDVQGTSSQGYPRRNFKGKTKMREDGESILNRVPFAYRVWDGIDTDSEGELLPEVWVPNNNWDAYVDGSDAYVDGEKVGEWIVNADQERELSSDDAKTKYKFALGTSPDAPGIKESTFCLKADYMESSSTHNTGLANYVHYLNMNYDALHHPLYKLSDSYRTTIFGFPILLFWEDAAGNVAFQGKYNFNWDKGATDIFGFTYDGDHPFVPGKTYEDVAECWELKNNQDGRATFSLMKFDQTVDGTGQTKLELISDFEPRYTKSDIDFEDIYNPDKNGGLTVAQSNAAVLDVISKNWEPFCAWVNSTDTTPSALTQAELKPIVYYMTIDRTYDPEREYFATASAEHLEELNGLNVTEAGTTHEIDGITYYYTGSTWVNQEKVKVTYSKNIQNKITVTDESGTQKEVIDTDVIVDNDTFVRQLGSFLYPEDTTTDWTDLSQGASLAGSYAFVKNEDGVWELNGETVNLANFGFTIANEEFKTKFITYYEIVNDWSSLYYEKFTNDDARYRLSKFRNEASKHLNIPYCCFYFLMTELLLLYDSRAKNMMVASWGPEELGGDYIWYPIFYDMDTQLGINNSGVVFWDYDTDASPLDGSQSIFSGQSSVLWKNMLTCFYDEIKTMYRQLRKQELLTVENLELYYDGRQCDKWAEIVKNIDAFFKYIAPGSLSTGGYITTEGNIASSTQWYYCLQGDRKLNRDLYFRNRINYIDSQWLGGSYYVGDSQGGINIQMRYDANAEGTSDPDVDSSIIEENKSKFQSNATFKIKPYLSQYCTVFFDQKPVEPVVKFNNADKEKDYVVIEPFESVKTKIEQGIALTQQLVYVYGPEYVSSLGDLSTKYLDEFWSTHAVRLRDLQIGNDREGYRNDNLKSDQLKIDSGVSSDRPKGLLNYLDISNLAGLTQGITDIAKCTKLETFKALGTNIPSAALPDGNILKAIYLPNTLVSLKLVEPQALTNIITDRSTIAKGTIEEVWDGTYEITPGLYVEDLTDKLDVPAIDGDLTRIDYYQIDNSKLGYGTYKILKKLYDTKIKMQAVTELPKGYSKELSISLMDVNWTPYTRVEKGSPIDETKEYYRITDANTYEVFTPNSSTWTSDLINIGIFTKDEASAAANPIANIAMIEHFIEKYLDGTVPYANYYFRSTISSGSAKRLPRFSGNIHVKNTAETALDEATLFNKVKKNYPDLTITADYINECNRARFLEAGADEYNTLTLWAEDKQRLAEGEEQAVVYNGTEQPKRLHYDFLGWSTNDALRTNHSIGTLNDVVMLPDGTWKDSNVKVMLNDNPVFYAVFKLHAYNVHFRNDDGSLVETVQVNSGSKITLPSKVPYKDSTALDLYQTYQFLGYGQQDSTTVMDVTKIAVYQEGLTFYAKYKVQSVYDKPLTSEELDYVVLDGKNCVYVKKAVGGKICIPKVITIDGNEISVQGIAQTEYSEEDGLHNGLTENMNVTHIFIEGTADGTSNLEILGGYSCYGMANLQHLDMPNTLNTFKDACLSNCNKLEGGVISPTKSLNLSASAFQGNTGCDATNRELVLDATIARLGNYSLYNCGYTNITVGSNSKRMSSPSVLGDNVFSGRYTNSVTLYVEQNSTAFSDAALDHVFDDESPIDTVVISN